MKLREIVKKSLEQLICLQTPVILMEDIYQYISDEVRGDFKRINKFNLDEKLLKQYILEEFDLLLYDIRIAGFWHFHSLLKTYLNLNNSQELKIFIGNLRHEKVLDYILIKAIESEDFELVTLVASKVETMNPHLVMAMKNKNIFEYLYSFNKRSKDSMLSISCLLEYKDIQEFLIDDNAIFNESAIKDIETKKYQYAVSYKEAKIIKDVILRKLSHC